MTSLKERLTTLGPEPKEDEARVAAAARFTTLGPQVRAHNKPGDHASGGGSGLPSAAKVAASRRSLERARPPFTDDALAVQTDYQGSGYEGINGGLRDGDTTAVAAEVAALDAAFYPSHQDVTVYRAMDGDAEAGDHLQNEAYTSTSLDPAVAGGFADTAMLEIAVPAGSPILFLPNDTDEVLLPRGLDLAVTGVKAIDGAGGVAEITTLVRATPAAAA